MKAYDLTELQSLVGETADPDYLAHICDDACFNIAKMAIEKPDDFIYGNPDNQLYYLRALRDIFSAMKPQQ
jgi:hypothetical protein